MNVDRKTMQIVGITVAVLIALSILAPVCAPKIVTAPDSNEAAMRVAEDALAMAQDAQDEAAALRQSGNFWYAFSLVLGVVAPAVIALLVLRYWSQKPVDEAEILLQLQRIEQRALAELAAGERKMLVGPSRQGGDIGGGED